MIVIHNSQYDIRTASLIEDFLNVIGLYTESRFDTKSFKNDKNITDINIIIINKKNRNDCETAIEIADLRSTIYILEDQLDLSNPIDNHHKINYTSKANDEELLQELMDKILDIYHIKNARTKEEMNLIIEGYTDNKIFEANLFSRNFKFTDSAFYELSRLYSSFINYLERIDDIQNPFLKMAILEIKLNMNKMAKRQRFSYKYNSETLIGDLEVLYQKYMEHEDFKNAFLNGMAFKKAQIEEIREDSIYVKWGNAYMDINLRGCSMALYKGARAYADYIENYETAQAILKTAIQYNQSFYVAYFTSAFYYSLNCDQDSEIKVNQNAYSALKIMEYKIQNHLLAPIEMKQMISFMNGIMQNKVQDYELCYNFETLIKYLKNIEVNQDNYLKQIFLNCNNQEKDYMKKSLRKDI